tara:strand:+ start:424 stop:1140 length:717 start_codon:yes stop_codon:yes gene_type:complete
MFKLFSSLLISVFIFNGCAPVFNEFQSADTVGDKNTLVTPYFSESTAIPDDSDSDASSIEANNTVGLRIARGISDKSDIHLKLEKIDGNGGYISGSIFSLGYKHFLYKDTVNNYRASFYLPITYATRNIEENAFIDIDEGSSTNQSYILLEPTMIASSKLHRLFDLNVSAKFIQKIAGDDLGEDINESGLAFNISGGITLPELGGISIIPEYGILFWDQDKFTHTGLGISLDLSKFKN